MNDGNIVKDPVATERAERARSTLGWVALFLGELRDGLTMINMQSAFLITSKHYTEKQAGILFFIFGISQFLFQTPAGYLMDYSDQKIFWLGTASLGTTLLTLLTVSTAQNKGTNLIWMIVIKFFQGAITALIPPGLNSITKGLVGSAGMTSQVSKNEMMNHLGTAIIVLSGSLLAFMLYPKIGMLFIVSPIACIGVLLFLCRIDPRDIDHNAARGLKEEADGAGSGGEYKSPLFDAAGNLMDGGNNNTAGSVVPGTKDDPVQTKPSFNFGWGDKTVTTKDNNNNNNTGSGGVLPKADTPLRVLRDPTLLTFIVIVFLFHTANGTILPLVMQTLAIGEGRTGILMSGLCIIVAQIFMVMSAKICGDYSGRYGRKGLFLIGFFTVPVRCLILTLLTAKKDTYDDTPTWLSILILSTQILDGVGAGTFGTMYILVTSDISEGTGRFSMTLGLTTAAMSIGGTVSGYLGEALAEDIGYYEAFVILGIMALVPALLYLFCMPETLPNFVKEKAERESGLVGGNMESIVESGTATLT